MDGRAKDQFLGQAAALLFPIRWPEPFGLAMVEALACGTPVIALRAGSVPEVIEHGVTGYICDTEDQLVEAIGWMASSIALAVGKRPSAASRRAGWPSSTSGSTPDCVDEPVLSRRRSRR